MKFIKILLPLLTLSLLSGCVSVFERDYFTMRDYVEDDLGIDDAQGEVTADYETLKSALQDMVSEHSRQRKLQFIGYEGDINEDISRAMNYIKSDTALGAYSVDYMYYSPRRIVSYYEVDIYVTYKVPPEQIDSLSTIDGSDGFREYLEEVMENRDQHAAFYIEKISDIEIISAVETIYRAKPLRVLNLPHIEIMFYTEESSPWIVEIDFDYGRSDRDIVEMLRELNSAAETMATEIRAVAENEESDPQAIANEALALLVIAELSDSCEIIGNDVVEKKSGTANTAYGALCQGKATKEGFVMAYRAVCEKLDIEPIDFEQIQASYSNSAIAETAIATADPEKPTL